jgi:hypothetical protein
MRLKFTRKDDSVISFEKWLTAAVIKATDTLRTLYHKHGVPPEAILSDLIWAKQREETMFGAEIRDELTKKLRSLKLRQQDAETLEKAAEIAQWWRPFLDVNAPSSKYSPRYCDVKFTWDCCAHLENLAGRLRAIEAQKHRPKASYLRFVATMLAHKFEQITGERLDEYIYELLRAFFPEKQALVSDPRKTIRNLLR